MDRDDSVPSHGPQVVVTGMRLARPKGRLLARLLAGQRFPGVGEATANKLWDAFGERLVDVLEVADGDALLDVLGRDARSRAQVETILLEWPVVHAEAIPRTTLTEVMRQAAETGIPAVAGAVRDGVLPDLAPYAAEDQAGVSILACQTREVAGNAVAVRRVTPGAQIVGSIKGAGDQADGGTVAMNAGLHDAWAAAHGLDPSTWLRGEPVIWTVNDYELDLWNGSLGKVVGMTDEGLAVRFDEGDRTIPVDVLDHLEPAWAITTHKAQGSQFGTVIVPVTSSRILDRTLIYTALTRGTRRVVLVGGPAVIRAAIGRGSQASRRSTWLRQAIKHAIGSIWEAKAA